MRLPLQFWPNIPRAVAVRGSDGMANYISNPSVGQGSIGYVEAGYVYEHSMTPAYIRNASGHFAGPTSINVSVGLKHATLNRDLTQNLMGVYRAPEANAYPLASYSYLITPTSGIDPGEGRGARRSGSSTSPAPGSARRRRSATRRCRRTSSRPCSRRSSGSPARRPRRR